MAASEVHVKKISVPDDLKALLKEYAALRVDEKKEKVCCCLTGHEMPLRKDAVLSYVQGKKFLKAQTKREYDFDQYKPHLIPNNKKGMEKTLFCTLTFRCVTKRPADVERHVTGKRYQRALQRWQKCQETGEKFKARGGTKRRTDSMDRASGSSSDHGDAKKFWQSDSEDDGNDADEDDLRDLYPGDAFASASEDDEGGDDEVNDSQESSSEEESTSKSTKTPANGLASHKDLKRKKAQKPGGKKKKRM